LLLSVPVQPEILPLWSPPPSFCASCTAAFPANHLKVGSARFHPATSLLYVTTLHCKSKRVPIFPWPHFRAPDQPHCLRLLYLPELQRLLLTSLPPSLTMQTSLIPTILATSTEVLTHIRRAQIRTTPTRSHSPPANLHRRKHNRDTRRSPTLASNSSTTAMVRGTTISNKLRASSQRRRRRLPLRTRLFSTHSRHSNNRQRHAQWRIQSRQANPQEVGQQPQRCRHISVLWRRRSLQELQRQQDRETTTIPDISKLLGHVDIPNDVFTFFILYLFSIYVRCLSYRGLPSLPLLFLIAHRFCDIV
jgi:hypothetical protein